MEAILLSNNGVTKIFKYNDIDLYVSKAFDDESDNHFLVCSIKEIPELNVGNLQLPIRFESEEQRDLFFEEFNGEAFINEMIAQIKSNKENQIDESDKVLN